MLGRQFSGVEKSLVQLSKRVWEQTNRSIIEKQEELSEEGSNLDQRELMDLIHKNYATLEQNTSDFHRLRIFKYLKHAILRSLGGVIDHEIERLVPEGSNELPDNVSEIALSYMLFGRPEFAGLQNNVLKDVRGAVEEILHQVSVGLEHHLAVQARGIPLGSSFSPAAFLGLNDESDEDDESSDLLSSDHSSECSEGGLSVFSFSSLPPYSDLPKIAAGLAIGNAIDEKDEAMGALMQFSPGDLLSSESWVEIRDSLQALLGDTDMQLASQAVELYAKLFANASPVQTGEICLAVLEHLNAWFLSHSKPLFELDTKEPVTEYVVRLCQLLLVFFADIPQHWVQYPDELIDSILTRSFQFLSTKSNPIILRSSYRKNGQYIQVDKKQLALGAHYFACIEPEGLWFEKWLGSTHLRKKILKVMFDIGFMGDIADGLLDCSQALDHSKEAELPIGRTATPPGEWWDKNYDGGSVDELSAVQNREKERRVRMTPALLAHPKKKNCLSLAEVSSLLSLQHMTFIGVVISSSEGRQYFVNGLKPSKTVLNVPRMSNGLSLDEVLTAITTHLGQLSLQQAIYDTDLRSLTAAGRALKLAVASSVRTGDVILKSTTLMSLVSTLDRMMNEAPESPEKSPIPSSPDMPARGSLKKTLHGRSRSSSPPPRVGTTTDEYFPIFNFPLSCNASKRGHYGQMSFTRTQCLKRDARILLEIGTILELFVESKSCIAELLKRSDSAPTLQAPTIPLPRRESAGLSSRRESAGLSFSLSDNNTDVLDIIANFCCCFLDGKFGQHFPFEVSRSFVNVIRAIVRTSEGATAMRHYNLVPAVARNLESFGQKRGLIWVQLLFDVLLDFATTVEGVHQLAEGGCIGACARRLSQVVQATPDVSKLRPEVFTWIINLSSVRLGFDTLLGGGVLDYLVASLTGVATSSQHDREDQGTLKWWRGGRIHQFLTSLHAWPVGSWSPPILTPDLEALVLWDQRPHGPHLTVTEDTHHVGLITVAWLCTCLDALLLLEIRYGLSGAISNLQKESVVPPNLKESIHTAVADYEGVVWVPAETNHADEDGVGEAERHNSEAREEVETVQTGEGASGSSFPGETSSENRSRSKRDKIRKSVLTPKDPPFVAPKSPFSSPFSSPLSSPLSSPAPSSRRRKPLTSSHPSGNVMIDQNSVLRDRLMCQLVTFGGPSERSLPKRVTAETHISPLYYPFPISTSSRTIENSSIGDYAERTKAITNVSEAMTLLKDLMQCRDTKAEVGSPFFYTGDVARSVIIPLIRRVTTLRGSSSAADGPPPCLGVWQGCSQSHAYSPASPLFSTGCTILSSYFWYLGMGGEWRGGSQTPDEERFRVLNEHVETSLSSFVHSTRECLREMAAAVTANHQQTYDSGRDDDDEGPLLNIVSFLEEPEGWIGEQTDDQEGVKTPKKAKKKKKKKRKKKGGTNAVPPCGSEGFDWYLASLFALFASGGGEPTNIGSEGASFMIDFSRLPSSVFLWPKIGGACASQHQVPPLWSFLSVFEQLLELELPLTNNMLRMNGVSAVLVAQQWLMQCFWNYLDWEDIVEVMMVPIVYGADYLLYLLVAMFKHREDALRYVAAREGNMLTKLLDEPLDGFTVIKYWKYVSTLHARHGRLCKDQLSCILTRLGNMRDK